MNLLTYQIFRGGGTGEAGEATASPEFRGFTTEKFLASWMYERGNFLCFTGKKLIPPPLNMYTIWQLAAVYRQRQVILPEKFNVKTCRIPCSFSTRLPAVHLMCEPFRVCAQYCTCLHLLTYIDRVCQEKITLKKD